MLRLVASLALGGCGRIAFEAAPQLAIDAPLDATAPDDGTLDGPADAPALRACRTDPRYVGSAGLTSTYRESTLQRTWLEARADCQADDADLWVIESALEQAAFNRDWIGITDEVTEGVWLKVDGTPAAFLPFSAGEPDGGTTENCLRNDSGGFADRECTDIRDYVCECPAP